MVFEHNIMRLQQILIILLSVTILCLGTEIANQECIQNIGNFSSENDEFHVDSPSLYLFPCKQNQEFYFQTNNEKLKCPFSDLYLSSKENVKINVQYSFIIQNKSQPFVLSDSLNVSESEFNNSIFFNITSVDLFYWAYDCENYTIPQVNNCSIEIMNKKENTSREILTKSDNKNDVKNNQKVEDKNMDISSMLQIVNESTVRTSSNKSYNDCEENLKIFGNNLKRNFILICIMAVIISLMFLITLKLTLLARKEGYFKMFRTKLFPDSSRPTSTICIQDEFGPDNEGLIPGMLHQPIDINSDFYFKVNSA